MKYSEFEKKIAQLGFSLSYLENSVYVEYNHDIVAKVDLHVRYVLDTHFNRMRELEPVIAFQVFLACCELSETKIPDRQEEERYWLQKIPVPLLGEKHGRYFCKALVPNYQNCVDIDRSQNSQFQTIFTESEIEEMDITGFEKVAVSE